MATLLLLMYKRRGVLTNSMLWSQPVVTFGAPSVFCEGSNQGFACSFNSLDSSAEIEVTR
jgi:hypothetical protein